MDYEQKYKEALRLARSYYSEDCNTFLDTLFPELRESEDEKNFDTIFNCLYQCCDTGFISVTQRDNALAWLEKQKEQKPAWSEVEFLFRGEKVTVKRTFYRDDKGRGYSTAELDEDAAWSALRAWCEKKGISLYDLYPKAEWSEEDEDMLEYIIGDVNDAKQLYTTQEAKDMADKEIDWLKSLRPSWKPSEEQMEAFEESLMSVAYTENKIILESLLEQLKKLCQ